MIWLPMHTISHPVHRKTSRSGFTLVELLLAMTATLLMMAALARAFAFVGTNIRDNRAEIQLSNELRDITMRIGDELSRCTVSLEPNLGPNDQAGYFMYHEGPVTNATSSIFLTAADGSTPESRYGDFDDYLAFTAIAPEGTWFSGKVPQGVLDGSGATNLVTIQSRYAEIAYFVAPDLVTGDVDANGLPDRFRLHRRVLLIRPDLNNNAGVLPFFVLGSGPSPMTAVHQACDLSVRRVLNNNGADTNQVAANSLADLTQPHNRFAHVRILVTSSPGNLSMPVLDLSPSVAVINGPVAPTTGIYATTYGNGTGTLATQYVLGPPPTTTGAIPLRYGEDLALNNILSFDVKVYDETATWFLDPASNLVVGPNDPGYRQVLTTTPAFNGGYVDLAYGALAGGPLRGSLSLQPDAVTTTTSPPVDFAGKVASDFSGIDNPGSATANLFTNSLLRSGRAFGTTGGLQIFQPTFDTFTSAYERDGLEQTIVGAGAAGTKWLTTATNPDRGANGLDDNGDSVADDLDERETMPPFLTTPRSIQVSIRIENHSTRQLQQSSVTWDGK